MLTLEEILIEGNLAELLEETELREISIKVSDGFETDKNSRSHREDTIQRATEKALQITEAKSRPWENASNVIYPLITYSCLEFATTLFASLIQDDKVVKPKIVGGDITPVLDAQGNLQPQVDEQTGQPVMDDAGNPVPQFEEGLKTARAERISTHMSFQCLEQMPCWEDDMDRLCHIVPLVGCVFKKIYYDTALGHPNIKLVLPKDLYINYDAVSVDTASRITEKIELTPNEIEERKRDGRFIDVDFSYSALSEEKEDPVSQEGSLSQDDEDSTQVFLEQHRWLDLDDDGYEEPYIVTLHDTSGQVVRIVKRFTEDDITFEGDTNNIARIKPSNYYIKYGFIPSFDGSIYDIGFGEMLLHINSVIDTIINQLIDAGTLANMSSGFIGSGLRMKGGILKTRPGEYKMIPSTGANFRENFIQIQHKEPSNVLFQMLGVMIEAGKEIASINRLLNVEKAGNMPATTAMAIIDQGLKTYKAINKRIYRAMKKEFKALYSLNGLYLNEIEYKQIVDDPKASKDDYMQENFDVVPVADPYIITDMQKAMRGQALMDLKDDPLMNQVEIRRRGLEAIGIEDVGELVQEPQPAPPDPTIELNIKLLQAQIELTNKQAQNYDADIAKSKAEILTMAEETKIDAYKATTEGDKRSTDAVKNLAQAEQIERGTQNPEYIKQIKEMGLTNLTQSENMINRKENATKENAVQNKPTGMAGMAEDATNETAV